MQLKNIEQHFSDKRQFVKKLTNLCKRVSDHDFQIPFGYIDVSELIIVQSVCNKFTNLKVIRLSLIPEFDERFLIIISPYHMYYETKYSTLYRVKYNKKYKILFHRDILGAFINNDINIFSIGGIIVSKDADINFEILNKDIATLNSISTISNIQVNYEEIKSPDFQIVKREIFNINVSSLRIDSVVKAINNCSRKKAQKMIESKNIKINQVTCLSNNREVEEGFVISIKGVNRFGIYEINKKTNGRFIIKVR